MIIVVSPDASPEDLDHIVARVEETGRQAHLSVGTERSIIGVIGPDERLPWPQTTVMGVQHVIAMFGSTVLAPILMGFDPNLAILMSGIGTLIFFLITGGKVPSYLGSSFAFIGVVIAAGMTIGTFFTLFITPAIYSYVARDRRHMHDLENESDVLEHEVVTTPANDGLALPKAAE